MPRPATDTTPWRISAAGLCWASQESGDSNGNCGHGPPWNLTQILNGENDGFIALELIPAGAPAKTKRERAAIRAARPCRLPAFRRRSGCIPAEPYPPLKRGGAYPGRG